MNRMLIMTVVISFIAMSCSDDKTPKSDATKDDKVVVPEIVEEVIETPVEAPVEEIIPEEVPEEAPIELPTEEAPIEAQNNEGEVNENTNN